MSLFLSKQLINGIFYEGILGFGGIQREMLDFLDCWKEKGIFFYGFGLEVRVIGVQRYFGIEIWEKRF